MGIYLTESESQTLSEMIKLILSLVLLPLVGVGQM